MREFLANPILPILSKIKESKKTFRIEYIQLVFAVSIALFVLVFVPVFAFFLAVNCLNG